MVLRLPKPVVLDAGAAIVHAVLTGCLDRCSGGEEVKKVRKGGGVKGSGGDVNSNTFELIG